MPMPSFGPPAFRSQLRGPKRAWRCTVRASGPFTTAHTPYDTHTVPTNCSGFSCSPWVHVYEYDNLGPIGHVPDGVDLEASFHGRFSDPADAQASAVEQFRAMTYPEVLADATCVEITLSRDSRDFDRWWLT